MTLFFFHPSYPIHSIRTTRAWWCRSMIGPQREKYLTLSGAALIFWKKSIWNESYQINQCFEIPSNFIKEITWKLIRTKKIASKIEHKTTFKNREVWSLKWRNIPVEGYFRGSERPLPNLIPTFENHRNVGDKL